MQQATREQLISANSEPTSNCDVGAHENCKSKACAAGVGVGVEVDDATLDKLARAAQEAKQHSYCPYSRFRVGAAVLTADGTIFRGCNVENASYPISVCAERVAFNKAVSEGYRDFTAIAIASDLESMVKPCGACIQTIREFLRDGPIVLVNYEGAAARLAYYEVVPPNGFTPLDLSAPPHPATDPHNVALILTKRPL